MNQKILISVIILTLSLVFASCSKNCDTKPTTCNDTPLSNDLCFSYDENWFYIEEDNSCELIGYSSCSVKGFESKQDCEACKCN